MVTTQMTPEQLLKYIALDWAWPSEEAIPPDLTPEEVETLAEELESDVQGALYDIRSSGIETGLPERVSSRHYECDEVALRAPNGQWVGWTYWYGGGKHGNPEEIDWIEHAYHVNCTSEEKLVVVHTFSKVDEDETNN